MPTKKLQIFISSTFIDLRDERQAAVEAILKAGHIPAGMELFAAGNESQIETIRRWIDSSDIYMLILGGRYGSINAKTGISYMEEEYDYAASIDKPIFAVVINDAGLDNKLKSLGKDAIERDHSTEYKAFKQRVLSKTCSFFQDCKDVKLAVHESIPDLEARTELKGWVSASDVPDVNSLLAQINRFSEENARLTSENKSLAKRLESPSEGHTSDQFNELISILQKVTISSIYFDPESDPNKKKPISENLLAILYASRDLFSLGITNRRDNTELGALLYSSICPKLHIHGLVINERIPHGTYRRYSLTKKGLDFIAYLQKQELLAPSNQRKFGGVSFSIETPHK